MSRRLFVLLTISFLVFAATTHRADAVADCFDNKTSGTTGACSIGQVCETGGTCRPFDLAITAESGTANSIAMQVDDNSKYGLTLSWNACLGGLTTCISPAAYPAGWLQSGTGTRPTVVITGLRPNRTYSASFAATFEARESTVSSSQSTINTNITPTASNIADTTATMNWTTPTNGDADVFYGITAPRWERDVVTLTPSDVINNVTTTNNGKSWFVTRFGEIWTDSGGSWARQPDPDSRQLRAIAAVDANTLYAVGDAGAILRTTNGGSSWATMAPPTGFTGDLLYIVPSVGGTMWAAGQNQRTLFYNGTTWIEKALPSPVAGAPLWSITSINNNDVWTGGTNGTIARSTNGGTSWTKGTITGATANTTVYALSTLDSQTIWAGGSAPVLGGNGRLWKSTNAGASWQEIDTGHAGTITGIYQVGTDDLWLSQGSTVGHYQNGTYTYYDSSTAPFSNTLYGISGANGARGVAVGDDRIFRFAKCYYDQSCVSRKTKFASVSPHAINLDGMAQNTTYYAIAQTLDTTNQLLYGGLTSFTTTEPDLVDPVLTITQPDPGAPRPVYLNFAHRIYQIQGTASDNLRLSTMRCASRTDHGPFVNVSSVTPALPTSNPAGVSATWYYQVAVGPAENSYVWDCEVSDGTNTALQTATVWYDNSPPDLIVTAPDWLDYPNPVPGPNVTVTGTTTDNFGIDHLDYILNSGTPVTVPASVVAADGSFSFSIPQASLLNGDNDLVIHSYDYAGNSNIAGGGFWYDQPGYKLALNPASVTTPGGTSAVYTATVTPLGGFTGPVSLSLSGQPAGSSVTFSQNPVVLGATPVDVTVTIATQSTPTGTFPLTLSSPTAPIPTAATATLIVTTAPDYSVTTTTPSRTVFAGSNANYTLSVNPNATYNGTITSMRIDPVAPAVSLPAGVSASFTPGTFTMSPSVNVPVTMTITTTGASPAGTYTLRVSALDAAARTRFVDVTLTINQPPDVTFTILPNTVTITAGAGTAANYNGKAIALNGYNRLSTITASVGSAIPGMGLTITPNTFVPAPGPNGTDYTMSITADSRVPGGTYTVTLTLRADDASLVKTIQTQLIVIGDTTAPTISITQPDVTANYDRVTVAWRTNEAATSLVIIYSDPARSIEVGRVGDPVGNPTYVLTHSFLYQTLNPLTTYYAKVESTDQAAIPNTGSTTTFDDGSDLQFTTLDTPDFIDPTITITNPLNGSTVVGAVSITGAAADNKSVSTILVKILRPDNTQAFAQTITAGSANYTYLANWNSLTDRINGTFTITAQATDSAGNKSLEASVTIDVENDLTKPRILTGPQDTNLTCDATNKCQVTIVWETDDASTSRVDFSREDIYFASGYQTTVDRNDAGICSTSNTICDTDAECNPGSCDHASPSGPYFQEHRVTLTNLDKNFLYHYRIWSCNISGDCTN